MKCELKGNLLEIVEIAQLLRNNNYEVNMEDGKIVIDNLSLFAKSCLYLKEHNLITKEQLLKLRQELYEKININKAINETYKIKTKNNKKILYKDKNKYFYIEKTTDNKYLIAVKNNNEDNRIIEKKLNKIVIPFFISDKDKLYNIMTNNSQNNNDYKIETIKYYEGYLMNIIITNQQDYNCKNVIMFKMPNTSFITNIYNRLNNEKTLIKNKRK